MLFFCIFPLDPQKRIKGKRAKLPFIVYLEIVFLWQKMLKMLLENRVPAHLKFAEEEQRRD